MLNEKTINDLVEITLKEPTDFLKIRETLTRIGVAPKSENEETNRLYQSCHILHKRGRYFIVHFKELLALDGKPTNFSDDDRDRRNAIAGLLEEWGLVTLVDPSQIEERAPISLIKVISFAEKNSGAWELHTKYTIGHKR